MSWIITGTQRYQPAALLDQFPGAAAAYSLRNLVGTSNPAVVRVRRDNDNAEQDFTATEVSDGTLAAWVGAGNNGFVRTWYDQSGNIRHMIQATAANQPKIVANGVVVQITSIPAIQFAVDNIPSNVHLASSSLVAAQPITVFGVANRNTTDDRQVLFTNPDGTFQLAGHVAADVRNNAGSSLNYQLAPSLGKQLHYGLYNGASSAAAINGATATTGNVGTNGISANSRISGFDPGLTNNTYEWIGHVFELIIYSSNQSTKRTGIEANINAHYSIY